MFKNLTIGKKLSIGYGVIIALLIIIGAFIFIQLSVINSNVSEVKERIDKINTAALVRKTVKDIYIDIRDILLTEDMKVKEEKRKSIDERRKAYREKLEELSKITRSER